DVDGAEQLEGRVLVADDPEGGAAGAGACRRRGRRRGPGQGFDRLEDKGGGQGEAERGAESGAQGAGETAGGRMQVHQAAGPCSESMKMASMGWSKTRAMRKARGRDGS